MEKSVLKFKLLKHLIVGVGLKNQKFHDLYAKKLNFNMSEFDWKHIKSGNLVWNFYKVDLKFGILNLDHEHVIFFHYV